MMFFNEDISEKEFFDMAFNPEQRTKKFADLDTSYEDKKKFWKETDTGRTTKANILVKLKRLLTDKPRNFIAHVAARLRETYRKWLAKANKEKDQGNLKWYKNILRVILKCIDFVMRKLEGLHTSGSQRLYKAMSKDGRSDDEIRRAYNYVSGKNSKLYPLDGEPESTNSNGKYRTYNIDKDNTNYKYATEIKNKMERGDLLEKDEKDFLNSFIKGNMYDEKIGYDHNYFKDLYEKYKKNIKNPINPDKAKDIMSDEERNNIDQMMNDPNSTIKL